MFFWLFVLEWVWMQELPKVRLAAPSDARWISNDHVTCHLSSTCTLAAHLLWHVLEVFVLKVSLHAPNQAIREVLVPAAKAFAAQPRISKRLVDLMMI